VTWLPFSQQGNKVRPALGERHVQQARDDLKAPCQLKIRKVFRDGLGNLNRAKVLQPEVLCDDENLLSVLVWPQYLGTFADHEHAKVGAE
jgi:hypothetical protein